MAIVLKTIPGIPMSPHLPLVSLAYGQV
jgi:hypothetical protein